ncbi:hypothetical protein SAMN05421678_12165 [Actinopolymorpha cephalotaxi]|uniref:NAD(P)-dependent dehydrogenase, short-chain alcohol dehydrogenase family n=1 Tax=Actinopolymorpha cephalotaxi TaxID=504797 RepID=A0A1I3B080_9ACTN|nr:SDR family oxidoreductase [Actinopolymorpha cephalotaxi]NYH84262.1 hypothetical protein [Actinopolymorpha cephalotaxi]SFH55713.1 hypothetical protein SAMN05421678_12165 [Actinopolymorpha cephalotaxi]
MPPRYENFPRIAIVTGSDSGIGEACAVALAHDGYDVGVTWNTDKAGAEDTAKKVRDAGRRAPVAHLDLSEASTVPGVVDGLMDELGGIGVLVNNSGTGTSTPFLDLDFEQWRDILAINLDGAFLCAQRAARRMVGAGLGGRIINITSVHERAPRVGSAPYCAAKGGLGMLTQVLALELAEHGITANSIAPGEIATPMTGQENEDPHQADRPGIPVGRPGDAREIAAVAAFLASPASAYVNGASWAVDGGMLLMGPQAGSHLQGNDWRRP